MKIRSTLDENSEHSDTVAIGQPPEEVKSDNEDDKWRGSH